MVEVPVYRFDTGEVAKTPVDETVFGTAVRWRLLRDAVVMYQANARRGTHSVKTRAEVNYSNRKPYKQKGTGRARAGTRRSPLWRGGGVIFGPKPRDYSYGMPRKALRQALCSAMLGKLRDGEVCLFENANFETPRTKEFTKVLKGLAVAGSALVVLPGGDEVLRKSARNIARTVVRSADEVNAYDVVTHERIIFSKAGYDRLLARIGHVED
jgi:large subunit ribosomal protein L4